MESQQSVHVSGAVPSECRTGDCPAPQAKRIHGAPQPKNVPHDMQDVPPIPCAFKVGDRVTFTNDYGVTFRKTVRGFARELHSSQRFVYLDLDCWWFPVNADSLQHLPA